MNLAQLKVLCSLSSIPKRKNNFLLLTGGDIEIAEQFRELGWVTKAECWTDTAAYSLTKSGREAFTDELEKMVDKSKPLKPQIREIFGDKK